MVSHYKMGARSWSDRWTRTSQVPQTGQQHHSHSSPHHHHNNHLDHNTSTTTVYGQVPDDRLSHEAALLRERQIRLQSVHKDFELALPPSINLPDGEEYPYDCLQHLHLRNAEQESEILREFIRPPPNRTIFEGESPPPYRACSMGTLHSSSSSSSSSTFSLMSGSTNNGALRVRSADYSAPLVMRCQSMSTNNCSCSGHHPSAGSGRGSGGVTARNTTPVSHHLRIARLVNSRSSSAASSMSLPASSVTSSSSSSFCSFCDPLTAVPSSSPVNQNYHNGHANRCPNSTVGGCCRSNLTKTEQRCVALSGVSSSSSGGSSSSSNSGSGHVISTVSSASNSRLTTDNVNAGRNQSLTLTESGRDVVVVEEDRKRNCKSANCGGSNNDPSAYGDGNV